MDFWFFFMRNMRDLNVNDMIISMGFNAVQRTRIEGGRLQTFWDILNSNIKKILA